MGRFDSLSAVPVEPPARFVPAPALSRTHGPQLERLGTALWRTDPLADAAADALARVAAGRAFPTLERALRDGISAVPDAPEALRALFASVDRLPRWVDRDRQARGGGVVLRAGLAAGVVLGMKSLILGYASPAGNKPLVFSGRLQQNAHRRLAETSRFVQAISQPGGLDRFAPGFAITLKVRLIHAQVRRLILRSPQRWRAELWGAPINQHDMLATVLLFSVAMVDGLRTLGYRVTDAEADDVVHLWRHVGLVMGVDEAALPNTHAEGLATAQLIQQTQGAPDDDARALAQALFAARAAAIARTASERATARRLGAMHAVCRLLIGDALATEMGIPVSPYAGISRVVRPAAGIASFLNRLPVWQEVARRAGDRYWDAAVKEGLGDDTAHYAPPDRLAS